MCACWHLVLMPFWCHTTPQHACPTQHKGTHKEDYVEWIKASLAERAESMRKVKIDEVDEVEKLAAKVVAL